MLVKDAMSPKVISVGLAEEIGEIAMKMREFDIGAVPVCKGEEVVGMVTDRDIVIRGLLDGGEVTKHTAEEIMMDHPIWCAANEDVEDAVRLMEEKQIRRLPVVDEDEHLVGLLSLGDVSQCSSHELSGEAVTAISRHSEQKLAAV